MKQLILVTVLFLYGNSMCHSQPCGDSSSHLQYRTLPGDSFRITKSILTRDNSKVLFGAFLEGASLKTPFLTKIKSDGTVAWTNKLYSNVNTANNFVSATIVAEAANGNIFVSSI